MDRLRTEIQQFRQHDHESFSEAWERYLELLRKCPNQLIDEDTELQLFYKGLTPESRNIVNASAGGSLKDKTYAAVRDLFRKIAENGSLGSSERVQPARRQACMLEMDSTRDLESKLAALTNRLNAMDAKFEGKPGSICGLCQGNHFTDQCSLIAEPVNFVRDQGKPAFQQNWNNSARPQWNQQGHPSWQNQRVGQEPEHSQLWNNNTAGSSSGFRKYPPGFQNPIQNPVESKNLFEETMLRKMDVLLSNSQRVDRQLEEQTKRTNLLETSVKNMEVQIGQLAQEVHRRPPGGLPSDTMPNPKGKEQCHPGA